MGAKGGFGVVGVIVVSAPCLVVAISPAFSRRLMAQRMVLYEVPHSFASARTDSVMVPCPALIQMYNRQRNVASEWKCGHERMSGVMMTGVM
jgi:hypothetical protein